MTNNNKLVIAAAGSGKTTFLVNEALKQKGSVLITTFTEANEAEIRKKIIELNKCVPSNITIQTWFSFLLQHGVRPYQDSLHAELYDKRIGFFLTERPSGFKCKSKAGFPIYWGEGDFLKCYFTKDFKIYSDKISKFVVESENKTEGAVFERISKIFDHIFIDEVQDLAGWDLEVLKSLFKAPLTVLLVGDPRQVTYLTHHPKKYVKYKDGNILNFVNDECESNICVLDTTTLNHSHRNNKEICEYSSKLFTELSPCVPCTCKSCRGHTLDHEGIFLVKEQDVDAYCRTFSPTMLRYKSATYPEWTYGRSKGLTFDRVIIYPTDPIIKWVKNNSASLTPTSRSKFYVALTRAKYSVAIIYDYAEEDGFEGITKWSDSE